MERTGPTVPGSTTHIDVKLAAIGALSGIAAAILTSVLIDRSDS